MLGRKSWAESLLSELSAYLPLTATVLAAILRLEPWIAKLCHFSLTHDAGKGDWLGLGASLVGWFSALTVNRDGFAAPGRCAPAIGRCQFERGLGS